LLHKVIKNAIPTRISEKLHYTKEDLSTFESLKKAILKIDRDYWRKISDDDHRKRTVHILQNYIPRTSNFPNFEQSLSPSPIDITSTLPMTSPEYHYLLPFPNRPPCNLSLLSILSSNRKLNPLKTWT